MTKFEKPFRMVAFADLRVASSINMPVKYYFWSLTLECGHYEERRCTYKPMHGKAPRGFAAMWHSRPLDDMLPEPKKVRCYECGRNSDSEKKLNS